MYGVKGSWVCPTESGRRQGCVVPSMSFGILKEARTGKETRNKMGNTEVKKNKEKCPCLQMTVMVIVHDWEVKWWIDFVHTK